MSTQLFIIIIAIIHYYNGFDLRVKGGSKLLTIRIYTQTYTRACAQTFRTIHIVHMCDKHNASKVL
jgi:hypothetical protein